MRSTRKTPNSQNSKAARCLHCLNGRLDSSIKNQFYSYFWPSGIEGISEIWSCFLLLLSFTRLESCRGAQYSQEHEAPHSLRGQDVGPFIPGGDNAKATETRKAMEETVPCSSIFSPLSSRSQLKGQLQISLKESPSRGSRLGHAGQ